MKYAFIAEHIGQFQVAEMTRVLGVARSGFYAWRARQGAVSARTLARHRLDTMVADAFAAAKERFGAIRITQALAKQGVEHNRKTVAKSLCRQGLRAKAARKLKATTQSRHNLPVADNLLAQNFNASAPNQKWAGDITYLWTEEGRLYLAVVLDLYSRRVIGWAMSERMTTQLVCDALQMALFRRKQPQGVIVHSDRGSQYCLASMSIKRCSKPTKGNCYDNACSESFFHSLKVEAIHGERFVNRAQMREAVFEYIEVDYNRQRLHSTLGYQSPEAFEQYVA